MKECPICHNKENDEAKFCSACGTHFANTSNNNQTNASTNSNTQSDIVHEDPFDHTKEFDSNDVSENKIYAMLIYLLGAIGIIIALLSRKKSEYLNFHVKQGLKILITEALLGLIIIALCWTIIIPIVGAVMYIVLVVIQIMCFIQVCCEKSKDAPIIRSLPF